MIDWSWELLSPDEQVVLRRLAVHADGCTPEAAEAVCGVDVLDVLVRLVDRSLVVPVAGADGMRYRLLESVAAYCVDKLHKAGEYESTRSLHRQYYVELASVAAGHLYGAEQGVWLQRLDDESGNLRSALDGAIAAGDDVLAQQLVASLGWYWFLRGRFAEARRSLEAVPETPELTAWLAGYLYLHGDSEATALRDRCIAEVGPRSVFWMALHCSDSGDLTQALAMLEQCLKSFEQSGDGGGWPLSWRRGRSMRMSVLTWRRCGATLPRVLGCSVRWAIGGVSCRRWAGLARTRSWWATSGAR